MKTLLCYGDSNTWGSVPMASLADDGRFGPRERWTGLLREHLGAGWLLVDEGLPGRTTTVDDPVEGAHKNGGTYLLPCLESHRPLDAVMVLLGTNDLKARFVRTPEEIAAGVGILLDIVARMGEAYQHVPRLLLVAPPPVIETGPFTVMFKGGLEKSRRLAPLYAAAAAERGAAFLDAGSVIASSPVDGIHWDAPAHAALAKTLAPLIEKL